MTTRERTEKLPPLEKITMLVNEIDQLRSLVEQQVVKESSLDDLVDILLLDELAVKFGVSVETMRKKLDVSGGKVFKLGKKLVIRKIHFLEVIQALEAA